MTVPFKPPRTTADDPKPPRVTDHPLNGADDVLQPLGASIAHLQRHGAGLWAGAHVANMSRAEQDMLKIARDLVDAVQRSMHRRYIYLQNNKPADQ